MSLEQIKILEEVGTLEELYEHVARLQRTLRYLLNGNLDFTNIRAKGIVAENIDVDKLSAITADLGEITAGIIRGIEIYGSYIATSESGYPRIELSGNNKYLKVFLDSTTYIEIIHEGEEGYPKIRFTRSGESFYIGYGAFSSYPGISSSNTFSIFAFGGLLLGGANYFYDWSMLINNSTSKTLQHELDDLTNRIEALESAVSLLTTEINNKANKNVSTSTAGSHNHGIPDGTELLTSTGMVTWNSSGGHSHNQN